VVAGRAKHGGFNVKKVFLTGVNSLISMPCQQALSAVCLNMACTIIVKITSTIILVFVFLKVHLSAKVYIFYSGYQFKSTAG